MGRILFLDVDGAPFVAFEMLSLLERGHEVAFAGSRTIPEALKAGEFAPLRERELRFGWLDGEALAAMASFLVRRPLRTLWTLAITLAGHLREPASLGKLLATLGWTLAAARWAERHGVSHVHGNWAHLPATSAWIVSRLTGVPFGFSGHAGRDLYRTSALLGRKLRDARFVVVCNEAARRRLASISPPDAGKIHLSRHGVDLTRFRPRARWEGGPLLSVGNLDPAKGFDVAIEAVARLRREGRAVRYRIVGEGSERARLETLVRRLGVTDSVELPGRLDGEALVAAYAESAALVVPSRILPGGGRDGLPNVVVEAMAVGLPVVAINVAAIPEAIDDGRTGLLVPPDDPGSLAAALARVLDDAALAARLAEAARQRVEADFDRAKTVAGFCALFGSEGRNERSHEWEITGGR